MPTLTFQEFVQQASIVKPTQESPVDLLNKTILTCKNKHRAINGVTPEMDLEIQKIYEACMTLAASGHSPDANVIRSYLEKLESMGLPVLWTTDNAGLRPTVIYDHETLKDMYRDYLDSQMHSQKERKQLERHLLQKNDGP
jgi:hypothetical protein